jgi:REP element-mobilizing transposase RayT
MPRKPREECEGGIFHVYGRGNDQRVIFQDDADRRLYLSLLSTTPRLWKWSLHAYCLMNNHVHLLVETPQPTLGKGMQYLHGTYARRFNDRHGRTGHLFQGRYGAVRIETDEQLWTVKEYIEMNPVKAGLCEAPADWPWKGVAVEGSDPLRVWRGLTP